MFGVMQNVVIDGIRRRRDRRMFGHHMKDMVGNGNNR